MLTLKSLSIQKFTAFREAKLVFSSGINVLIGENSTGKTHILKLIYALIKASREVAGQQKQLRETEELDFVLAKVLHEIFKPEHTTGLIRQETTPNNGEHKPRAYLRLDYGDEEVLSYTFSQLLAEVPSSESYIWQKIPKIEPVKTVFLPSREVLSIYPGFIAAYLNRETAFDETYYDLCVSLNANPLRKEKYEAVKHLVEPLAEILGGEGRVVKEGDHFFVDLPDTGKLEAQLVAEGYRKLASLVYLIRNGSLTSDSVLLWDEPEANLNPKLVTAVVDFLINLANAGAQIFLATHDYLFSHELSLRAEYGLNTNIKFFSLYREEGEDGVLVESGDTLAELTNNPILDAYVAHNERENELFYADETKAETG